MKADAGALRTKKAVSYPLRPSCATPAASKDGKLCQHTTPEAEKWTPGVCTGQHGPAHSGFVLTADFTVATAGTSRSGTDNLPQKVQMNFTMALKHTAGQPLVAPNTRNATPRVPPGTRPTHTSITTVSPGPDAASTPEVPRYRATNV